MVEIVTSKIYLTIDSFGNRATCVCEDSCDTVQICGMKKTDGSDVYFESEAYHLYSWANDCGINLKVIEKEYSFDELWKEAK